MNQLLFIPLPCWNRGGRWNIQQQRLLFTALMTAQVQLQQYQLAREQWQQHVVRLYQDEQIPLQLLILDSLATQRNDKETTSKPVN